MSEKQRIALYTPPDLSEPHGVSGSDLNGVFCGTALIRDAIPATSLCKTCTRVLQDCRHVHKNTELKNSFTVVVSCVGYESFCAI